MATLAAIERQLAKLKSQADAMLKKQGGAIKKILKQMKEAGVTVEDIVDAADLQLNEAKAAGRNCVHAATLSTDAPAPTLEVSP